MSHKRLIKSTIIYSIGELIPKVVGFLLMPIYTYYLSPSDYGILSYTNSVTVFLFVLGALSLNTFVLRHYFEIDDIVEKKKLLGNIFLLMTLSNLVVFSVSCLVFPPLLTYHNIQIPWKPYFRLALLINLLDGFSILPLVIYRVKQQAGNYIVLILGRFFLQSGLTIFFIVNKGLGVLGNYYAILISLLIFFFIYLYVLNRNIMFNINFKQIKSALQFSLPLLPGAIAYLILSISDRIILERSVSISDLGIYNIAFTLSFALNMVIQSGYKALEPEIFKRFGNLDFGLFIVKVKNLFFALIYLGAMVLSLFSQEIFKIMAPIKYYKGYMLVPIIIVGVIMTGQNVIFAGILSAEKKTKIIGISTFVGACVSIILNIVTVPVWGIYAAAINFSLAFATMNLILYLAIELENKSLFAELLALIVFLSIVSGVLYLFPFTASTSLTIIIKLGLVIFYYLFLAIIFKVRMSNILLLFKRS